MRSDGAVGNTFLSGRYEKRKNRRGPAAVVATEGMRTLDFAGHPTAGRVEQAGTDRLPGASIRPFTRSIAVSAGNEGARKLQRAMPLFEFAARSNAHSTVMRQICKSYRSSELPYEDWQRLRIKSEPPIAEGP